MEREELLKSLESVIDETLFEIEELRKSADCTPSEITIGDKNSGIDGQSRDGKIEKAEDDKKDDEDKDKKDDDKKDDDKDGNPFAKFEDGAMYKYEDGKMCKMESMNTNGTLSLSTDENEGIKIEELNKSHEKVQEELAKSFNNKIEDLEGKLSKMAEAVTLMGEMPVERKGVPSNYAPLNKSEETGEPLSKSDVADKLFELKKSGETVSTTDIARVELGNENDLRDIAAKYGVK